MSNADMVMVGVDDSSLLIAQVHQLQSSGIDDIPTVYSW